uniref:Sterol 14 desaturase n=1 Tax=Tetraselmis sp. GSL018 TaxID=582737 RepID=A0A061QTA1_9CHLO
MASAWDGPQGLALGPSPPLPAGMLIAVLFAGQHTSSITSTWTGLYMIDNPEVGLKPALEEQRAIVAKYGERLDMEVLNKMDVLHRNMTEALRLQPPLVMLLRKSHKAFDVTTSSGRTYTIPKGHVLATSPAYQHRLPSVFRDPAKYDPDRFAPGREEDKRSFSFIGFGGGRHGCMGSNFAYLQIKTIWSVLLRNFEFELIDPFPEPDYESMVVGPKPCRVRYTRRNLC